MQPRHDSFTSPRGSVLMVALIFAVVLGISLMSYLQLANTSLRTANRSFYANSAMNVAEIGIEQAIACFNQLDNNTASPTSAWPTAWTQNNTAYNKTSSPYTPYAVATFSGLALGPGATGSVKVYAHHHTGSNTEEPMVVAKATVTQADGTSINKYIEITLRKRSLFDNGLVARYDVIWKGQPMAASWNSDPGNDGIPPFLNYDSSLKTAEITVGSLKGNIGLSNGEVWGYAKTGPSGTISGGSVHGMDSTTDDPTRRTNDFNTTFPTFTTPTTATPYIISTSIKNSTAFPRTGDTTVKVDVPGKGTIDAYYYKFASGAGITLSGSDAVTINNVVTKDASGNIISTTPANVIFVLENHTGTSAISVTGSTAGITIADGSSLNVYTNGNVAIAGNGLINNNAQAANCMIWGTGTTGQTIDIKGNGELKAVVYAPNANVTLDGGGTSGKVMGAVIANQITMNGGTEFYWDEALAQLTFGNPYGLSKWRELTTESERAAYTTPLSY